MDFSSRIQAKVIIHIKNANFHAIAVEEHGDQLIPSGEILGVSVSIELMNDAVESQAGNEG